MHQLKLLAFENQKAFIIHVIWLNNCEMIVQNILSNDFTQWQNKEVQEWKEGEDAYSLFQISHEKERIEKSIKWIR